MKTVTGLLPWGIVLIVAAVAIWIVYERNAAAGRWVLAGFLVAHGLIHLLFTVPTPETAAAGGPEWPFNLDGSWLAGTAGVDTGLVQAVGLALVAAVVVGFALSGLATAGLLVPAGWWPALVAGSSGLSLLALLVFFSPSLVLGLGLDATLIWIALASTWRPALA